MSGRTRLLSSLGRFSGWTRRAASTSAPTPATTGQGAVKPPSLTTPKRVGAYSYDYTIPARSYGSDGSLTGARLNKRVEEWSYARENTDERFHPFRKPGQMISILFVYILFPYFILDLLTKSFMRAPYGFGPENTNRKRRFFGYEDPKYWPSYEQMKKFEDQRPKFHPPELR